MSADDKTRITDRMMQLLDRPSEDDDEDDPRPIRSMPRIALGRAGRTYQRPHNALDELFRKAPAHLQSLMSTVRKEVEAVNPEGEWPDVPYHYGMGRIAAYDNWLGRLDEKERARAIAACRARYEAHYQRSAELLIEKMRDHGFDLTTITRGEHESDRARRPVRDYFGWDGPTLGGGRSRGR